MDLIKTKTGYVIENTGICGRESRIVYYKRENFIQLQYGIEKHPYLDEDGKADRLFQIVPVPGSEYSTIMELDPKGEGRMVAATWCSSGDLIWKHGIFLKSEEESVIKETYNLVLMLFLGHERAKAAEKLMDLADSIKNIMK